MSTDAFLPPPLGQKKHSGGEPRGSHRWRSILCAGDCGKKITVIDAVRWVLCGTCQNRLGSVADRLERERRGAK